MSLIIGILGRPKMSDREFTSFSKAITDVIIEDGHIPLGVIAPIIDVNQTMTSDDIAKLHQVLDLCDGFIFQGGSDYYQYDLEAIKYIYEKDIPILGICLGMQSIGVAFGAYLTKVPNHCQIGIDYVHPITIDEKSKLYEILGTNSIFVNSRHNEIIINPVDINIVGHNDNVIEAVEKENTLFFLGVQWHPEDMVKYDIHSCKIFNALFSACKTFHEKKFKL